MIKKTAIATGAFLTLMSMTAKEKALDFVRDVKPILEFNCVSCHQETKSKGKLRLDSHEQMLKGAGGDAVIVAGKPDKSTLYTTTILDKDDDDVMPPLKHDGDSLLTKPEITILKRWITEGAKWPKGVNLKAQKRQLPAKVDFVKDIQPILEYNCISCHGPTKDKGDLRLDTKAFIMKGGENDACIVPGKPLESSFFTLVILHKDDDDVMPPAKAMKKGQVVSYKEIALLRRWIEDGAEVPADISLKPKKRPSIGAARVIISSTALYKQLGFDKLAGKVQDVKAFKSMIPGTTVEYEMLAIPAGKFKRGGSEANEKPVREITIDPFWMQKFEMSWDQYEVWQFDLDIARRKKGTYKDNNLDKLADIVSRPTGPYLDMSFGMGKMNRPAVSMTQLAAKCYAMWLSAKTGHFYRLPTEAEWEYACRAGTTTKYHFGDDEKKLPEYGWFYDNSDEKYQERGTKKPNPWGLYDMHGNVSEWVIDSFEKGFYKTSSASNPVNIAIKSVDGMNPPIESSWPTKLYGRIARGGNWNGDAVDLRSATRQLSNPEWKIQDPQLPKSVWYHTDAIWNGFRLVRASKIPELKDLHKYWPSEEEIKAIPQR
jgi:formylglycine-generating enzyme required for sulfatase activity